MRLVLLILLMFIFVVYTSNAQNCKLHIEIKGFEEIRGKLSIGLFNDPVGFPKNRENRWGVNIDITDTLIVCNIDSLHPGEYALAIYHDENGNGKLDSNFFGMPTEDYVFSNYAKGTFGPPSFEDAKFKLTDSLDIHLELNK